MTAKINVKNMDYFKFKKIVIDGSRDDYESCSREIRSLCDAVQTLSFRDEQFADDTDDGSGSVLSDRRHFDEILAGYRLILTGKRVDPVDIRVKTGWWADSTATATSSCGSAGKFKSSALRETLLRKTTDWWSRHGGREEVSAAGGDELDRPGVFVFKHRERQCFQYVGRTGGQRAGGVFAACADLLKSTFDGTLAEPIAALLLVSMSADWDFHYLPLAEHDDDRMLRIAMNDVIIRHDALWPRGLNELLFVQTPLEVAELRASCLRHRWPPTDADLLPREAQLNLPRLRARLQRQIAAAAQPPPPAGNGAASGRATSTRKGGGGIPRAAAAAAARPSSASSAQRTSPTKSTQQQQQQQQRQSTKSSMPPSPSKQQRPALTTKSNASSTSPTKSPRSRPQSAPKPPPTASTSSRPPQPSESTPRSRPQSAKTTTGGGDTGGTKAAGKSSTTGRVAAAPSDVQSTSDASEIMPSVNKESSSQPHTNVELASVSSAAESNDLVSPLHNESSDRVNTVGCQQIPAAV